MLHALNLYSTLAQTEPVSESDIKNVCVCARGVGGITQAKFEPKS